jgi:hypothetical protein
MNNKEVLKELEILDKIIKEREDRMESCYKSLEEDILKFYPHEHSNSVDIPIILARILTIYDLEDEQKNPCQLYLEWMIEHFIGKKIWQNMEDVDYIYKTLKENNNTIDNKEGHGHGDSYCFYIPHKDKKIFSLEGQSHKCIVIFDNDDDFPFFHIREYWDSFPDLGSEERSWMLDDWQEENNIKKILIKGRYLLDNFSDNFPENKYVERPDLNWHKDNNFDLKYGDCRDAGYVISLDCCDNKRADRPWRDYSLLKVAFFDIMMQSKYLKEKYEESNKPKEENPMAKPEVMGGK